MLERECIQTRKREKYQCPWGTMDHQSSPQASMSADLGREIPQGDQHIPPPSVVLGHQDGLPPLTHHPMRRGGGTDDKRKTMMFHIWQLISRSQGGVFSLYPEDNSGGVVSLPRDGRSSSGGKGEELCQVAVPM